MKNLIYTLLLLMTISGELVHLAYMLSCDHDSIELVYDIKGENESEENKDLEEEASEIPHFQINLDQYINDPKGLSSSALASADDQFDRVATPPPDYL